MKRRLITLFLAAAFIIPVYPNSEKKKEITRVNNGVDVKTVYYVTRDSVGKVLDYYKQKMTDAGWEVAPINVGGVKVFYRLRETVTVLCKDILNRGQTDIFVNYSLVSEDTAADIQKSYAQDTDMPGEDLAFVPRYPGSIRRSYDKAASKQVTLAYESKQGCLDCVLRFYRSEMVAKGWGLVSDKQYGMGPVLARKDIPTDLVKPLSEMKDAKINVLNFSGKLGEAEITVMDRQGTIAINIVYNP